MKPHLLAVLVLVAGGASAATGGEIRGRVTLAGRPAVGATISAVPFEAPLEAARREARRGALPLALATAETHADGTYVLALSPETPSVVLRVAGPGIVAVRLPGVFDGSERADVGEVRAVPAATLAGHVVDARGAPVPGTLVTLEPVEPRFGASELRPETLTTTTGADGSFRFAGAAAANRLRFEADGFATSALLGVRAGTMPSPVVLGTKTAIAADVSGVVLGPDGRSPVAGALVRFEGSVTTRWAEAGPDGRFRLDGVPVGSGRVVAEAGARGRVEQAWSSATSPGAGPVRLVLIRPSVLTGRLVDAFSGAPVPRVRVEARLGPNVEVTRSGPDGRYRLEGLPPGSYRLAADEPRRVPYERGDVVVHAGKTTTADLPLTPGATVSGRVVDERGAPIEGASGRIAGAGRARLPFLTMLGAEAPPAFRTGRDGTFRVERLAPGDQQQLTVSHPEYERRLVAGLSLPPGGTKSGLTVVLRPGLEITGAVLDLEGRPVAGAEVTARPSASERSGRGGAFLIELGLRRGAEDGGVATGADGRFRLAGLSPGAYTLAARRDGYADEQRDPVRVERDEPAPAVELRLGPGASIRGVARRGGGSPAKGVVVRARPEQGSFGGPLGLGPLQPTGADGAFSIDGLRAGESYTLQVLGIAGAGPRKAGVQAPADDVDLVLPGAGRIAGRVVDAASREPLPEFTASYEPEMGQGGPMRFLRAPRRIRRLVGDGDADDTFRSPDGAFALEDVPAGTYTLVVEAAGYETARVSGLVVREDDTTGDVEVRAAKGRVLRGRVLDSRSGRPVVGATVAATEAGGMRPPLPPGFEDGASFTDADGRFEVLGLSLGTHTLLARHADYAEASQLVELKQAVAEVEVRLSQGATLAGLVVSEGGAPVGGATVSVQAGGAGRAGVLFGGPGLGGSSSLSDDGGRFRFDRLSSGRYSVSAALRGRSSPPLDVPLQAGESREDLRIALEAGATVRGRVSGLDGARLASTNVIAQGPDGFFSGVRPAPDGTFTLGGVPPGTTELRAMAGDFDTGTRTASAHVEIAEGQRDAEAEIVFDAVGAISGTVTRGGQALAQAMVMVSGSGPGAFSRTDEGGAYRLEGLRDGTYTVTVSPSAGAPRRQTVEVAGEATLDFVLPLARISGTVVEAGSGLPLAEAEVETGGGGGPRGASREATDSRGHFSLEGLEPGPTTITARRAGYVYEQRTVDAKEDGADELRLELKRGEGLGLRARDAAYGVPLRGLFAQARSGGSVVFGGGLSLDSEGRGEIPSLRAGAYSVRLEASGYAPLALSVTVPSPTLDVSFTAGGSLEIRSGPETQARSPRARLVDAAGAPVLGMGMGPGAEGFFTLAGPSRRLEHLAPGPYTLVVEGGPTKAATVTEGGRSTVELP